MAASTIKALRYFRTAEGGGDNGTWVVPLPYRESPTFCHDSPVASGPRKVTRTPRAMTEMALDDNAYGACCYRFVDSRPSPRLLGLC
jgi:hypothetical protein